MKIYTKVAYYWDEGRREYFRDDSGSECFEYNGPVDRLCGASHEQKDMYAAQKSFYDVLTNQAKMVFGKVSALYDHIVSQVQPIFDRGPNQKGFSQEELDALNSGAITQTGQNYAKAAKAVNENIAAQGGGNTFLPSGAADQMKQDVATSAANLTSQEESQILQADYQQGYNEWLVAGQALMGAPNVFNPAVGFNNSANGAGNGAAATADAITQANNSWMGAIGGLVGQGLSGWATGGFKMPGGGGKPA